MWEREKRERVNETFDREDDARLLVINGEGGLSVGVMEGIETFDREDDARLLVINGGNLKRQLTLNAW